MFGFFCPAGGCYEIARSLPVSAPVDRVDHVSRNGIVVGIRHVGELGVQGAPNKAKVMPSVEQT
jgi:hypothetical protein